MATVVKEWNGREYDLDEIADWIVEHWDDLPARLMDHWGGKKHEDPEHSYVKRGYREIGDPKYFLSFDIELAAWRHLRRRREIT